ncbi:ACP S-malonyltransferase [bacterium]|nr:ACP S-malonyltransferase [bacterium]
MPRAAFLFSGQGSQAPGMGRDLYDRSAAARRVLDDAARAADFDLLALCFDGPAETLALTAYQQPSILAVSVAAHAAARDAGLPDPVCVFGHSLGEWSALVAADALALANAIRLVSARGRYMQEAVPAGEGGMVALLGCDEQTADAACREAGDAWPANLNGGGQIVISGRTDALERAVAAAKAAGVRRATPLPVSAPFHSPLMQPAADRLRDDLAAIAFGAPSAPVISNVDARAHEDTGEFSDLLYRQVTSRVLFEACVREASRMGARVFVEFGPGGRLAALVKRILPDAEALAVSNADELESALARLAA